jgi:glycine/sarcosine N-methyltransferase
MDNYKILAKDYDYINPKEEIFRQENFFRKLIEEFSVKTCLDCACGTGWHLFMLDELGILCSGSDLSSEMLASAKKNLESKNVPLLKEDFCTLSRSWKQKFDMVICMTTSLPHMLTDKDVIKALNSMYRRLNDGGVLVISNGIADSLLDEKPRFIPARILKDQAFYFFLEYPSENRVIFNILQIKKTIDSFAHAYDVMHYNAMRKSVLERCFARTKFREIHYYGDHDFTRYSAKDSKRLVVVAEKQ